MENYNELIAKSRFYKSITSQEEIVLTKINLGAGPNIFPSAGWINYDRETFSDYFSWLKNTEGLIPKDSWQLDGPGSLSHLRSLQKFLKENDDLNYHIHDLRKPFTQHSDNSVDLIYIGQVIEHLNPIHEAPRLMAECYRMMKPGSVIRLTTPDLDLLIQHYLAGTMNSFERDQPEFYKDADAASQLSYIMFGATGPNCTFNNYEGHMFLYNQKSMTKLLTDAGFKEIVFYYETGLSKNYVMQKEVIDAGISHSFIVEAIK